MKLTIFAATGGIGRLILTQALAAGHDVTAVVRNPAKLSAPVKTVVADLASPDRAVLESAVSGADAVLSGLGAGSRADSGVAARGTNAMINAMEATDVRRIVVVSAAPVGTVASPHNPRPPRHDPGDGLLTRHVLSPLIKKILREHYTDLATMEEALRESGLDWTIVRPPRLTDKPLSDKYRTAFGQNLRGGLTISRADVAHLMLQVLHRPETNKTVLGVAN
jgi:putative NADH-flavin reductase